VLTVWTSATRNVAGPWASLPVVVRVKRCARALNRSMSVESPQHVERIHADVLACSVGRIPPDLDRVFARRQAAGVPHVLLIGHDGPGKVDGDRATAVKGHLGAHGNDGHRKKYDDPDGPQAESLLRFGCLHLAPARDEKRRGLVSPRRSAATL